MRQLSKKEWIAVALALVFVAYMFFGGNIMDLFSSFKGTNQTAMVNETATNMAGNGGIETKDVAVGTGPEVQNGMEVAVNYVLKLSDGTVIQDSKEVNAGQPFKFVAGAGQLIKGWEMGILGMKVGSKRMIVIPPELGYGSQQVGPIPPDSTLIFEIEVVSAKFPG
jgi:FKBP-type peptidyl-prolyl cis-trans isomerase